jgi:WD40 repeat protein
VDPANERGDDVTKLEEGDALAGLLPGHVGRLTSTAAHCSSGSSFAVTASVDGTVRMWDLQRLLPGSNGNGSVRSDDDAPSGLLCVLDPCARGAKDVAIHPDGSLLAIADEGGYTHLTDCRTGRIIGRCFESHLGAATRCRFAPHGMHVATAGTDGAVKLFDLRMIVAKTMSEGPAAGSSGRGLLFTIAAHNDMVTDITFAPPTQSVHFAARAVVTASTDGTIAVHSTLDGAFISRTVGSTLGGAALGDGLPCPVRSVCFARGDTGCDDLVSVAHDATIRMWGQAGSAAGSEGQSGTRQLATVAAPAGAASAAGEHTGEARAPAHGEDADLDEGDEDDDDDFAALRR